MERMMAKTETVSTTGGLSYLRRGRGAGVYLEGVEDLEAALRKLSDDVQGEYLRAAVDAGSEIVRDVASQLAPRSQDGSHGRPAGFLSENIIKERQWTKTQLTADTYIGPSGEAWYGILQETGTVFAPAQPFLRPALDETKNDVVDEVAEQLRKRILREV